jgi:hypothetical protein
MFKITKFNLCVIGIFVGIGLNIQRQVSLEMTEYTTAGVFGDESTWP